MVDFKSKLKNKKAAEYEEVDLLSATTFAEGGFSLPEGRYSLEFNVVLWAPTKKDGSKGQERLGVMVTFTDGEGKEHEQFYGVGSKAIEAFMPHPEHGKSLVRRPGATGGTLYGRTNWDIFRKSLIEAGMPEDFAGSNVGVLDGMEAITKNIPEPEERKGFGNSVTGEEDEPQKTRDRKIAVVSEVVEAPWEEKKGKKSSKVKSKAKEEEPEDEDDEEDEEEEEEAPKAKKGKKKPAEEEEEEEEEDDEEDSDDDESTIEAFNDAAVSVLEDVEDGDTLSMLAFRTSMFKVLTKQHGKDDANGVMNLFTKDEDRVQTIIEGLGFSLNNGKITRAPKKKGKK